MAGHSKRNLTHNRTCIKDICTGTIIFVTSMRFPVLVNWHWTGLAPCSQANGRFYARDVKVVNGKYNISWYCWPFFSWVKLLHPLPFKNYSSHKNCDFESETFADTSLVIKPPHHKSLDKSVAWQDSQASQYNHLSVLFFNVLAKSSTLCY